MLALKGDMKTALASYILFALVVLVGMMGVGMCVELVCVTCAHAGSESAERVVGVARDERRVAFAAVPRSDMSPARGVAVAPWYPRALAAPETPGAFGTGCLLRI